MTHPKLPHKRSLHLLHIYLPTHRTRPILRLLLARKHMKRWSNHTIPTNSHSIHRLCPPMRTNIILRSNRNHQPTIRHPIHWRHHRTMNLRWTLSKQCNTHTLYCPSLPPPIRHPSPTNHPPNLPTRTRILQPRWIIQKHRQNPISPLLHHKRCPRGSTSCIHITHPCSLPPNPARRP